MSIRDTAGRPTVRDIVMKQTHGYKRGLAEQRRVPNLTLSEALAVAY